MRIVLALLVSAVALSATSADEMVPTQGLYEPVEVLVDRWGVAHIYANNEHDLFFAQGYSACQNRLFQFEMWRRRATGTMAEILGPRELDRDIGARLHRFRKDLRQELQHYHPRGVEIIGAFVDGVNAYVDRANRDPESLPIEFQLLGIQPGRWTPEVVISRHQGLLSNVIYETALGEVVAKIGPEEARPLDWFRPGKPKLALDPAIDGSLLGPHILHYYRAFRRPVVFQPEDIQDPARRRARRLEVDQPARLSRGDGSDGIGSNNWVVSGRFTQSGFPYVANDPHRAIEVPSLRYFAHLVAPGWNVIGGGEPVLPGISIGHNPWGGWGLTVFGQDNEDLYVYDLDPEDANRYRYRDQWEEMKRIGESIPVRGQPDAKVELRYTRHGPVLHVDKENHKAYALRAAWMEIGNAPYLASLRMNQAQNWAEFVDACAYSNLPAENMIWGGVDKTIGYQAVGISPIRRNWSGLVPVPGDGRYEWDGYLPIKELPHIKNPRRGYWATANNFMVPNGYRHPDALHYTWGDEMRGLRVDELMASGRRFTIVDMMEFQQDELSIPARTIVPLLKRIEFDDPHHQRAVDQLANWDFVLDKESTAAAIYVSLERHLLAFMREQMVPAPARDLYRRPNLKLVIDWLVAPDGRFGADPIEGRDEMLRRSLAGALADLRERFGPDMTTWVYGSAKFKHVKIRHPLSAVVDEETQRLLSIPLMPRGGDSSTLNNTGYLDNQVRGATFRVVMDTANWDNSIATGAPGQSGDPDSPHYRDQYSLWARGKYFPLFYSRDKVESVTEATTWLVPPSKMQDRHSGASKDARVPADANR